MRDESVARGQPHATREIVALILYTTTRMRKLLLERSMIYVLCVICYMLCVICYMLYVLCSMFILLVVYSTAPPKGFRKQHSISQRPLAQFNVSEPKPQTPN